MVIEGRALRRSPTIWAVALVSGAALALPALAQTTQNPAKRGPTDATGATAPAGTAVAPLPPPDATTAGSAAPGIPVPPIHATGGHPGDAPAGTPGTIGPSPDASTQQSQPPSR